jgi:dTDP-4-amino-4,6-dideoxygalactose transaminase
VSAKLPHLDEWTAARQRNARRYDALFAEAQVPVGLPAVLPGRHIFNQYVIRVPQRDQLQAALQKRGVGTEVYYPVTMHLQECFAYLGHAAGAFPQSERAAKETLAVPVSPEVTDEQARYVVDSIRDFYTSAGSTTAVGPGLMAHAASSHRS